jgi:activator of HSP90 ATPase
MGKRLPPPHGRKSRDSVSRAASPSPTSRAHVIAAAPAPSRVMKKLSDTPSLARSTGKKNAEEPMEDTMFTIHHEELFPAPPSWLYDALVDPSRFTRLSRARATGEAVEGAQFTRFGGLISGRHLELVPGKRIVDSWRLSTWPEGVHSIARIELDESATPSVYGIGTKLTLVHEGLPEELREEAEAIWNLRYRASILSAFC